MTEWLERSLRRRDEGARWPTQPSDWGRWEICVCPACGRLFATNTGKNQLHCSGVGTDRHDGVVAERIEVVPAAERDSLNQQLEELLAAVEDLAAYLRAKPHDPAGRLYATAKRIREATDA